jgi:thermostable 8-oxoguanine DNA glycosylase
VEGAEEQNMKFFSEAKVIPGFYTPTKSDRKKFEELSVCILTPCRSHYNHIMFTRSVANMIAYSWLHGLKVYQMGVTEGMVVDWARNDLSEDRER